MNIWCRLTISSCFFLSVGVFPASTRGDVILDLYGSGTAVDSWAYSKAVGVGRRNSTSYVPRKSDATGDSFVGYVNYPDGFGWLNRNSGDFLEDSIRTFRTYVLSDVDQSIDLRVGIDDGHSIYVNDAFVDGDGFGVNSFATLSLTAGIAKKVEVLGYNGPGPSQLFVRRTLDNGSIRSTPFVRINADGNFAAVPEPKAMIFIAFAVGLIALHKSVARVE